MIKSKRLLFSLVVVMVVVLCAQFTAFAAVDDIPDEADIYLTNEPAYAPRSGITVSANPEGTKNSSIANSPAVRVDATENITIASSDTNTDDEEDEIEPIYEGVPNTGAPSMAFPIGTALLALGCIPVLMKKK